VYGPAGATATAFISCYIEIQIGVTFLVPVTRVILEKRFLVVCSCVDATPTPIHYQLVYILVYLCVQHGSFAVVVSKHFCRRDEDISFTKSFRKIFSM